jgi:hypothetical protein
MPRPAKSKRKNAERRLASALTTNGLSKPQPSVPQTSLATNQKGELRWQASLDAVADSMGGREEFLNACIQSDTEVGKKFIALYRSLSTQEQITTTLQDLCVRCEVSATDLVGSMMGKLIMQSNNVVLLKRAMAGPSVMDANIALALGDSELALEAQKIQFQIGGFLRGEGKQIYNLTQNVQGTGILSFEDDTNQSVASVKAEGRPVIVRSSEPIPVEADANVIEGE